MTIDRQRLPAADNRGFDLHEEGDELVVDMHKNFDMCRGVDRWAQRLVEAAPGPYRRVVVDVGGFTVISSTIIAGLVYISDVHVRQGATIVLRNATDRVVRTLEMTRLAHLFSFDG